MIATDLYDEDSIWMTNAKEGDPEILCDSDKFAPFPYRKEHLEIKRMNGCKLEFPDNTFDFIWSCSSIEHFGGHEKAAKSMKEMERVLKPRGVLALATEFVISQNVIPGFKSEHPDFFNLEDLYKYLIASHNLKLVQEIDFSMDEYYIKNYIKLPEESQSPHTIKHRKPHIVLCQDNVLFTSIFIFFQKEIDSTCYDAIQKEHVERMEIDANINYNYYKNIMIKRYSEYMRLIKKYKNIGKLLDIGSGFSDVWYNEYVKPNGYTYYCTDMSCEIVNHMSKILKDQGNDIYAKQGLLEKIPWSSNIFDIVYISHILEHSTNINKAFSEIDRVLKIDGIIVFAVPCGYDDEPAHMYNRELEEWKLDFEENNWEILESGQFPFNQNEFDGIAKPIRSNHI